MRRRKTWSGPFHCALCGIEEELEEDDRVECLECGGLMAPGPLFPAQDQEANDKESEEANDGDR